MGQGEFTVIVRCADPRLTPFFGETTSRRLMGLEAEPRGDGEAHISNVGGLLPFSGAAAKRLAEDAGALLRIFGRGRGRLVLTAHSLCAGYAAATGAEETSLRDRQIADLREGARRLTDALPGIEISCFYLKLEDGTIEPVDA